MSAPKDIIAEGRAVMVGVTGGKAVQFHPYYCEEAKDAPFSTWDTSHDLSVIQPDGTPYRIGSFKHAADAEFDQWARNNMPALLDMAEAKAAPDHIVDASKMVAAPVGDYAGLVKWAKARSDERYADGRPHFSIGDADKVAALGNAIAALVAALDTAAPALAEALAVPEVRALVEADPASAFDRADWYWRTMDPDDCGDSPEEAINRGMVGLFCVCEIASSYSGPTRYGFLAPVQDPDSDDEEFVHFATQQEAIDAAKERSARLAALRQGGET